MDTPVRHEAHEETHSALLTHVASLMFGDSPRHRGYFSNATVRLATPGNSLRSNSYVAEAVPYFRTVAADQSTTGCKSIGGWTLLSDTMRTKRLAAHYRPR